MMYAIVKDFENGPITHEEVFNQLKEGGLKLMCYDTEYSWMPNGKIQTIHVGHNGKIVEKFLTFNYPNEWTMFHDTKGKFAPNLPWGPWYYGYIAEIED